METTTQQTHELSLKNICVQFLFAYQQKNLEKMLSFCEPDGTVNFMPLGKDGVGKIGELGRSVWGGIIECFSDLDNTVDAAVAEDETTIRAQVVIRGTQQADFAGITNQGKHFDSDHIFIFRVNESGKIDNIEINWDHEDFKRQLGAN